jgi:GDP-mannose 6-dehydrogenase
VSLPQNQKFQTWPVDSNPARVAVMGLGYVGCVSSACLAAVGHRVIGVDRDTHKIDSVMAGAAPFHEPFLDGVVAETVHAGRLTASSDLRASVAASDIVLVCVGTPSNAYGNLSTEQLDRVFAEIAATLGERTTPLTIAVRSTVYPGTCDELMERHIGEHALVSVVSNPEFLREGTAVKDFIDPSLVVVGGHDAAAVDRVAGLYSALDVPPAKVSLRSAEMIKYACNAFHALKVAFANEIGTLAATLGVPPAEVMETLCLDTRLNVSKAYLRPGFAFGGSCLPKDLRALNYRSARANQNLPLLESILDSNQRHLDRAIHAVLSLPARRLGVFGLTFKEDTDDLRESPVVALIEALIGKGRQVRIYDPNVNLESIYGSNKNFLLNAVPHIGNALTSRVEDLTACAEYLILAQKPAPAHLAVLEASGLPVLDLVGPSLQFVPRQPSSNG